MSPFSNKAAAQASTLQPGMANLASRDWCRWLSLGQVSTIKASFPSLASGISSQAPLQADCRVDASPCCSPSAIDRFFVRDVEVAGSNPVAPTFSLAAFLALRVIDVLPLWQLDVGFVAFALSGLVFGACKTTGKATFRDGSWWLLLGGWWQDSGAHAGANDLHLFVVMS
jgi:hypothetical protein